MYVCKYVGGDISKITLYTIWKMNSQHMEMGNNKKREAEFAYEIKFCYI